MEQREGLEVGAWGRGKRKGWIAGGPPHLGHCPAAWARRAGQRACSLRGADPGAEDQTGGFLRGASRLV